MFPISYSMSEDIDLNSLDQITPKFEEKFEEIKHKKSITVY